MSYSMALDISLAQSEKTRKVTSSHVIVQVKRHIEEVSGAAFPHSDGLREFIGSERELSLVVY
jgi:hypothetical protein